MTPLRILIGADTYPPDVNGAARFAERLATGLARRGHDVHVVCPSADGPAGRETTGAVTVHRIRSHRYPLHPTFRVCLPRRAAPATAAVLAAVDPDVVHVQAHFVVGRNLVAAARAAGRPVAATNHFMPENLVGHAHVPAPLRRTVAGWAWRDLARVYGRADVVTAPTPRAAALLAAEAGLDGALPVSCGIDVDHYRTVPPAPDAHDVPTVLFVGRLDQEKRVDELLRAFAALPATCPARLEIVGDGTHRAAWTALARRLGVSGRTRFHGFVDEADLLAAYGRAAVFCMPGVAELQSLATLEAMAAGTPVVAADAMALPHLVQPGRNGWLYPPGDVGALTARLATLLGDPELRGRMGTASRELVARHELGVTLAAFEAVYRRLLDATGAAAAA